MSFSLPECRHVFASGLKCRAVAMRGQPLCHHHDHTRTVADANRARKRSVALPPLEDFAAVQIGIDEILAALSARKITRREAGTYLYGVQMATRNLVYRERIATPPPVDLVKTEQGDILAAPEPPNVGTPGPGSPQTGPGLWGGDSSQSGTGEDSESSEDLAEDPIPSSSTRNIHASHAYENETAPPLTRTAIKKRRRMIDMHLKSYYRSRAYYRGLPANHPDDPPFVLNWIKQQVDPLEAELKTLNESAKPDPALTTDHCSLSTIAGAPF